ncbi:ABC transporter ATP-binding protein [Anaerovibrio sp.]|uniref:ABC transporter ATP-binding protein n=1 Tax=Anaerovibrio sp. TaxID=1872532 RepID=UPI003F142CD3
MNNAIIQVENITAGYHEQNPILEDVSFNISRGEFVGIIGKNGAGKSTLLKSMRGFLPVWSGRVMLAAKTVGDYQERELARKIAYLQQQVELTFDYTARDIVMAGRYPYRKWWQQQSDEDRKIVAACMEYTGVLEMADKPIRALSGGQRQRVLLSKVLAQQTPVLFLDEPAAGLDLFYQEEIFRFCQELCHRGKTVVMVVHELNLAARYCSRLLLARKGRIIADDVPEKVLTRELLTAGYGVPIEAGRNPETGHADIYTVPEPMDEAKRQLLATIIGGNSRHDGCNSDNAGQSGKGGDMV